MKLSIIIVNFNTYEYTKNAIISILNSTINFNYEIILIDNASVDDSAIKLEVDFKNYTKNNKIRIIKNEYNMGFARANNIGIKISKAKYILLLNSDTKVYNNTIQGCIDYLEKNNDIAILGCKILLEDGRLDHACKRGFPTPSASLYYFLGLDRKNPKKYGQYDFLTLNDDEIGYVDAISGAFMLIPRNVIEKVGLLDEDYFMYAEDIDYCYNVKKNGFFVIYYPKEKITHYKNKSWKKRKYKTLFDFHNAMWIFYKKNYIKNYNFLITMIVYIGIWIKCLISFIKNIFLSSK